MRTPRYTPLSLGWMLALLLLVAGSTSVFAQGFTPANYCASGLGAKYEIDSNGNIVFQSSESTIPDIFDLTVTDSKENGTEVLEVFWQFALDDDNTTTDYVVEAYIEKGGNDVQPVTFPAPATSGRVTSNDNKGISFFILCVSENEVPCVAVSLNVEAVPGADDQFTVTMTSADGIRRVEFRDVFGGVVKLDNVEVASFTGNLAVVTPGVDYIFDPVQFAAPSTEATFTLQQVDPNNPRASFMVVSANACGTVAFDPPLTFPTKRGENVFALAGNAPNPFRESTKIAFTLAETADVELAVFNLLGQQVARQSHASLAPGPNAIEWDGRSSAGERLSSGVYFYRLTAGTRSLSGRLMMVR